MLKLITAGLFLTVGTNVVYAADNNHDTEMSWAINESLVEAGRDKQEEADLAHALEQSRLEHEAAGQSHAASAAAAPVPNNDNLHNHFPKEIVGEIQKRVEPRADDKLTPREILALSPKATDRQQISQLAAQAFKHLNPNKAIPANFEADFKQQMDILAALKEQVKKVTEDVRKALPKDDFISPYFIEDLHYKSGLTPPFLEYLSNYALFLDETLLNDVIDVFYRVISEGIQVHKPEEAYTGGDFQVLFDVISPHAKIPDEDFFTDEKQKLAELGYTMDQNFSNKDVWTRFGLADQANHIENFARLFRILTQQSSLYSAKLQKRIEQFSQLIQAAKDHLQLKFSKPPIPR